MRFHWRELAVAVLAAVVATLVVVLVNSKTAQIVALSVIAVLCVLYLLWDSWFRVMRQDRIARRRGITVERGRYKRTVQDGVTTTEWSDGRRDVNIKAKAAMTASFSGNAIGTVTNPPRWKRWWLRFWGWLR